MKIRLVKWWGRSLSPCASAATSPQNDVHAASDSSGAAVFIGDCEPVSDAAVVAWMWTHQPVFEDRFVD